MTENQGFSKSSEIQALTLQLSIAKDSLERLVSLDADDQGLRSEIASLQAALVSAKALTVDFETVFP